MAEDFKKLAEKIARARQSAVDEIAENLRAEEGLATNQEKQNTPVQHDN